MIRSRAMPVPFLGAFSINHLFLLSEFVSWTIMNCKESPSAPKVASVCNNTEASVAARKSLLFGFCVATMLPAGEGEGGGKQLEENP